MNVVGFDNFLSVTEPHTATSGLDRFENEREKIV